MTRPLPPQIYTNSKRHLIHRLKKAGLPSTYWWILEMESKLAPDGKPRLICPRDPVNGRRKFTDRQIDDIIKAFSPGGPGIWRHRGLGDKLK